MTNPHVIMIHNDEKQKVFSQISGTMMPSLTTLSYNIIMYVLATAMRAKKEKNIYTKFERKEVKLSLFADDVILYEENPISIKALLELRNTFSTIAGYKIKI